MIKMDNNAASAVQKIKEGQKLVKGQKERLMAPAVCEALMDFAAQDDEFARAVLRGKTVPECLTAVAAGVGGFISDLEAYKKAVQFYFPGAEIRVAMTIDMVGAAAGEDPAEAPVEAPAPDPIEMPAPAPAEPADTLTLDLSKYF